MRLSGKIDPTAIPGRITLAIDGLKQELLNQQLPKAPLQWESAPFDVTAQADLPNWNHVQVAIQAHLPSVLLKRGAASVAVKGITLKSKLAYSPPNISINLEKLEANQPFLALRGQAVAQLDTPLYQFELTGNNLKIDPLRQASLALAGDDEIVAGIFDVLRSGNVPWIRFKGQTAGGFGRFSQHDDNRQC